MVVANAKLTLATERLLIRPLTLEDAPDIAELRADPEVMKHTSLLPTDDIRESDKWIKGCHDRPECWIFVIELLWEPENGTLRCCPPVIGTIGAVRAPEIGYMLKRQYWGKGYATEALQAFVRLFFEHYSGRKGQARYEYAEAHVDPECLASQNVLQKADFRLAEVREKDFDNPKLGLRDTWIFRTTRPEE
ncbi:acyl-CoA N-acyltransferase [Delitschia confertaspora ATCC 74209]|uniref:Acyl-CoA N-acyltransferase n=1 Tax=Delitschia confertaspora ATCC 74209 TaxID=1513339 RepID=A0A9P4MM72_9PLEO|nr:acyl-CoA N-acyltransferase [Delitschia confertaspora ATCC 74209]